MSKSGSLAVFDIGKSSLKLIVCSADASRVEHAVATPNTVVAGPPYPHFNIDQAWEWLLHELSQAARRFDIEAIIPVTHGATAVLMAGSEPALPVLDYEHTAPQLENAPDGSLYETVRPAFARTLSPALPCGLNLGRQLWWQSVRFPEQFARVDRIFFYPQYWSWKLSGVAASEVTSIGCHTDLWCPLDGGFSPLVETQSWRARFPEFQRAGKALGPVLKQIARRTGVSETIQVMNGIHDSNASYFRHLAHYGDTPFSVLSTGTWVVAMGGAVALGQLDETRDCLANVDVNGKPVPCSRFMGGREFEVLTRGVASPVERESAALEAVCALIAQKTFPLPSFAPSSGPFARRRGEIRGAEPRTDLEAAALAALYLALMCDACLSLIDSQGDIHVEGKLGGDMTFLRILAALRPQQTLFVTDDSSGTAIGAALLATGAAVSREFSRRAPRGEIPGLASYSDTWRELASTL